MENLSIRPFSLEDRIIVKDFISQNIQEFFNAPAKNISDLDNINESFEVFLLAFIGNDLVGTIGIKKDSDARISRMYVTSQHRKKGIGTILLKNAIQHCKGKYNRVFLSAYQKMNSLEFFKKNGFNVFKIDEQVWLDLPIK